ncbi:hypothetical protein LCGC14_0323940 [marine sediment metagenome]|uniref:Uncharacterized protein n=1 Tax=marine sediment metagenome TaxID=412755 RepID=A0A0F9WQM0_9ZZZZ
MFPRRKLIIPEIFLHETLLWLNFVLGYGCADNGNNLRLNKVSIFYCFRGGVVCAFFFGVNCLSDIEV